MSRRLSTVDFFRGIGLALLGAALWGLAPVATKAALEGYSPELIGVLRLGLAAVFFRAAGGPQGRWLPADAWSWAGGVALGADFVLYNYGMRLTSASLAGLVVNVELVSTIALAVWLLGEQLSPRRVVGSAVTLAGVLYVGADGVSLLDLTARDHVVGNALVMLAGISWSLFAISQRKAPPRRNLFQLLCPIFVVATMTTAPTLLRSGAWHNSGGTEPTSMLVLLIVLCTMGVYVAYGRSQQLLDVSMLAIILGSIPVFAVGFAWLLLGEPISFRVALGGTVIIAGVLVITTERPATELVASAAVERAQ